MATQTLIRAAEKRMLDVDERVHDVVEPLAASSAMPLVDRFGKLGDQPEIRSMAGAMLLAGIFGGSDRLVRAGARMMIAHEAATSAKDRVKDQVDRKRPRSAANRDDKKLRAGHESAKE